jgi:hypothetical protein
MLSCDCSSISRLCRVLLTSVISDLDVLRVCVLTTTSVLRFSDYFRGGGKKSFESCVYQSSCLVVYLGVKVEEIQCKGSYIFI